MKLSVKVASTSQTVNLFIQDSSSTVGAGLASLVYNTSGLTCYYALPRATPVAVTLATLAAVTSAWSSGGFKELDATNMPGWYRLDLPDAVLASGRFVSVHLKGAANMAPCAFEIELTGWDNQVATNGGLSCLPAANPGAAGGLTIAGSNAATTFATLTVSGATTLTGNVALAAGLAITQSTTNGVGLSVTGNGTGAGVAIAAGATGKGLAITTTAGDGFSITPTGGHAIVATGNGTSKHGFVITGGTAGTSDGLNMVAGTGGVPMRGDQTGNMTGNVSGSVGSVTGAVGSVTGNVGGNVVGSVASVTADVGITQAGADKVWGTATRVLTAGTNIALAKGTGVTGFNDITAASVWGVARSGNQGAGSFGEYVDAAISTRSTYSGGAVASVTGNVGGNVVGSVGSVTADVGITQAGADKAWSTAARTLTAGTNIVLAKGTGVTGFNDVTAASVWGVDVSTGYTDGQAGAKLNAAGTASDPWATALPGSYATGTAGKILGTNLDATVSSRSVYAGGAVASVTAAVTVGTVNDKTGYSLTQSFPTNFASLAITAGGAVTSGTVSDKAGYSLSNGSIVAATFGANAIDATAFAQGAADKAWSTAARVLTAGTNIALAKGTGVTGFNDIAATSVWGVARSGNQGAGSFGEYVDAAISTRSTFAGGAVASVTGNVGGNVVGSVGSVTAAVTAGTVSDKAGYSLSSSGLDSIATTAPTGVASNFREMVVQVWRRFFKKSTMTATQLITYADNGTTPITTQVVSDDQTTQTQGAAS